MFEGTKILSLKKKQTLLEQPVDALGTSFTFTQGKVKVREAREREEDFSILVHTVPALWNASRAIHPNFLSVLKINTNGSLELSWRPKVNINNQEDQ